MWVLFVAVVFAADDLSEIKIPPDAVERRGGFRPWRLVKTRRAYFVDDQLVGERLFYADGQIADERLYNNKKLHGVWRQWYPSGKLFSKRPYREGQMDGTFRFWSEEGKLLGESEMKLGTGVLRQFGNTPLHCDDAETPYLRGKMNGWGRRWARFEGCKGVGSDFSRYRNDMLDGYSYTYDEDGMVLGCAFFQRGKLHGYASRTDHDGKPIKGYPAYRIDGNDVSELQYMDAAKRDKLLKEILEHKPPKLEDIPTGVIDPDAKQPAPAKPPSKRK